VDTEGILEGLKLMLGRIEVEGLSEGLGLVEGIKDGWLEGWLEYEGWLDTEGEVLGDTLGGGQTKTLSS